jgi:hypothetical protein
MNNQFMGRPVMKMSIARVLAVGLLAACALSSFGVQPSLAASKNGHSPRIATSQRATDFSAARRRYYRRDDRAALGAFLGVVGTIATIAEAEHYRRHYYDYGYYPYYGPYPYYAPPPPPYYYYRPRYYRYW